MLARCGGCWGSRRCSSRAAGARRRATGARRLRRARARVHPWASDARTVPRPFPHVATGSSVPRTGGSSAWAARAGLPMRVRQRRRPGNVRSVRTPATSAHARATCARSTKGRSAAAPTDRACPRAAPARNGSAHRPRDARWSSRTRALRATGPRARAAGTASAPVAAWRRSIAKRDAGCGIRPSARCDRVPPARTPCL